MINIGNYALTYYSNVKAIICVEGTLDIGNNSIDVIEVYNYEVHSTYKYYKIYGQRSTPTNTNRFSCWFPVFEGVDKPELIELIKSLLLKKLALIICMEEPYYQTFFKIKGMYEDVYDIYTPPN